MDIFITRGYKIGKTLKFYTRCEVTTIIPQNSKRYVLTVGEDIKN